MKSFELDYGSTKVKVSIEDKDLLGIIESKPFRVSESEDEIILNALQNPIGSPRLKELVNQGKLFV